MVAASPSVSNRDPQAFDDPEVFDPTRYLEPREDDVANPWSWIPFGAGRHRCVGKRRVGSQPEPHEQCYCLGCQLDTIVELFELA